jgi:hypothetical protein
VIDAVLNSFAQNLHFSFEEFPCFASGVTHSTNVRSIALERGHGVVCFFRNKRTNVWSKRGIIERHFYQTTYNKIM